MVHNEVNAITILPGVFKIEDSVEVARLWGIRKNRPAMNYDKLSRSIRQYYKKGIIKKTEISQRLVYQFVKPVVWCRNEITGQVTTDNGLVNGSTSHIRTVKKEIQCNSEDDTNRKRLEGRRPSSVVFCSFYNKSKLGLHDKMFDVDFVALHTRALEMNTQSHIDHFVHAATELKYNSWL